MRRPIRKDMKRYRRGKVLANWGAMTKGGAKKCGVLAMKFKCQQHFLSTRNIWPRPIYAEICMLFCVLPIYLFSTQYPNCPT